MRIGQHLTSLGVFLGLLAMPMDLGSDFIEDKPIVETITEVSEMPKRYSIQNFPKPTPRANYEYDKTLEKHIQQIDEDSLDFACICEQIVDDLNNSKKNICPAFGMLFDFSKTDKLILDKEVFPCYENTLQGFYNSDEAFDFLLTFTEYFFNRLNANTVRLFETQPELEDEFDQRYIGMLQDSLLTWREATENERQLEFIQTNLEMVNTYLESNSTGYLELEVYDVEN
ncbi:MAG: hypothetical protein ABIF40_00945 [archaeon]